MTINYKICTKCQEKKEANSENFYRSKKGKFGFKSTCKECEKIYRRVYENTVEYRIKKNEYARKWREKNKETYLKKQKQYRDKNKSKINARRRYRYRNDPNYRQSVIESEKRYKDSGKRALVNNKEEYKKGRREYSKKYNKENKEKIKKYNKKYRKENREYLIKLDKQRKEELTDSYIKQIIKANNKLSNYQSISPETIETKRLLIKIKRELKNGS